MKNRKENKLKKKCVVSRQNIYYGIHTTLYYGGDGCVRTVGGGGVVSLLIDKMS